MTPKFDPNKPFTVVEPKGRKSAPKPKFNPNEPYEPVLDADISSPSAFGDMLTQAGAVLDIPGAATRNLLSEEGKSLPEYARGLKERGSREVFEAPTGKELLQEYGMQDEGSEGFMSELAGAGAEMVTDPSMLVSGIAKVPGAVGRAFKGVDGLGGLGKQASKQLRKTRLTPAMENQTAKALAQIQPINKTMKDAGVDANLIAKYMVEQDLVKYINRPKRLKEVLEGVTDYVKTPKAGGNVVSKTKKDRGLIGTTSDELYGTVEELSSLRNTQIPQRKIADSISSDILEIQEAKTSGVRYSQQELAQMDDKIYSILDSDSYTLPEIMELKKNIGKQLNSKEFYKSPDKAQSLEAEVLISIRRKLDDVLKNSLEGKRVQLGDRVFNAKDYYELQNNKLNNMLNLRTILDMVPERELREADLPSIIASVTAQGATMGAAGGLLSLVTDMPFTAVTGGAVGFGLGAGRKAGQAVSKNFPAFTARSIDVGMESPRVGVPMLPQMQRSATNAEDERQINRGRGPDNVPLALTNTRIPRTTQGIIENRRIVLAKIAQNKPEMYEQAKHLIDERPQDLPRALPMVMAIAPELFEMDEYNRIDNKILDPMMQEKARQDIERDEELTNIQKMELTDKLNRTMTLEGYK